MTNRNVRDGADAVHVGEPRGLRHERERRAAADAARADGDGVRPRVVPRRAARLQPVERHDRAARARSRRSIPARPSITSKSPTAPPRPTTSSRSARCGRRRRRDAGAELHADVGRRAQPRRRGEDVPAADRSVVGTGLGRVRARRDAEDAAALSLESEQPHRLGAVATPRCGASSIAASRPGRGCCPTRSISARRSARPRTKSFWGMGDRVIVTSGLSKAYGIPGVRIGWIVGPTDVRRGVLEPARLHHDRPEQDVGPHRARRGRGGEPRALLRAHRRDPAAQPADRARVGWSVRRPPDVDRAGGRRDRR